MKPPVKTMILWYLTEFVLCLSEEFDNIVVSSNTFTYGDKKLCRRDHEICGFFHPSFGVDQRRS